MDRWELGEEDEEEENNSHNRDDKDTWQLQEAILKELEGFQRQRREVTEVCTIYMASSSYEISFSAQSYPIHVAK